MAAEAPARGRALGAARRAAVGATVSGWIIVDERVTRADSDAGIGMPRYRGRRGYGYTVGGAGPFESRRQANVVAEDMPASCVVRRVVPAGTKRARAAAQAAEDNAATLRAELDGLRATDEEMTQRLAAVTAERDEARRELAAMRQAIETLIAGVRR